VLTRVVLTALPQQVHLAVQHTECGFRPQRMRPKSHWQKTMLRQLRYFVWQEAAVGADGQRQRCGFSEA
jgi:hypothetical protein